MKNKIALVAVSSAFAILLSSCSVLPSARDDKREHRSRSGSFSSGTTMESGASLSGGIMPPPAGFASGSTQANATGNVPKRFPRKAPTSTASPKNEPMSSYQPSPAPSTTQATQSQSAPDTSTRAS